LIALLLALNLLHASIAGFAPGMERGALRGNPAVVSGTIIWLEQDRVVRVIGQRVDVAGKPLLATGAAPPGWLSKGVLKAWPANRNVGLPEGKSYTFREGQRELIVNLTLDGTVWKVGMLELRDVAP